MEVIKSCSQCGACERYKSTLGYSTTKILYYPCSIPPSQPSMKTLLERTWRAKRLSQDAKKKARAAPSTPQDGLEKAEEPVERKTVKTRPSTGIPGLLSRRRGKHVMMTVEIPKRDPFPPPLAPSG